ncbi:MAG: hypothetical protein JWM74_6256 [Myxococcaceae bacterium]|nr:hypothetical protein [Myxococcaceae bacterium]
MGDEEDKTGTRRRMTVPFGDGALRVELGEPFVVEDEDGRDEWVCIAKLLGREKPLPWLGVDEPPPVAEAEITHTMFLSQGRGGTPEAAIKDAMTQLERAHLPDPLIRRKPSTRPPKALQGVTVPPARVRKPPKPKPAKPPPDPEEETRRQRANDEATETKLRPAPKPKSVPWLSRLWQRNKA